MGLLAFELLVLLFGDFICNQTENTVHVYPGVSCSCLQTVLNECAVSGLVVSRMEAILEHGGFDVVVFIERNCINLSSNLYPVHFSKISKYGRMEKS